MPKLAPELWELIIPTYCGWLQIVPCITVVIVCGLKQRDRPNICGKN